MRRTPNISENNIRNVLRGVINEAYGTPTRDDREFEEDVYNIKYGGTILPRIIRALKDCYWDITDNEEQQIDDPKFRTIVSSIKTAILNAESLLKDEKMRRGLQPDPSYDSRHSKEDWKRSLYNGKDDYRPTFDNAPWPHSRY